MPLVINKDADTGRCHAVLSINRLAGCGSCSSININPVRLSATQISSVVGFHGSMTIDRTLQFISSTLAPHQSFTVRRHFAQLGCQRLRCCSRSQSFRQPVGLPRRTCCKRRLKAPFAPLAGPSQYGDVTARRGI